MPIGYFSATHLNGNLICVVDVETTGVDPERNEIIQICVLPLDSTLKPMKKQGILPFYTNLQPLNLDAIDYKALGVNQIEFAQMILNSLDPHRAADLFYEWFQKLGLAENKRISPLAHNWPFDRDFIIKWLGLEMYNLIFDGRYRDSMPAALFCNDLADVRGEPFPYSKLNLKYLASTLKIEHSRAHDAMADCLVTAEVYRRMVYGPNLI